MLVAGVALVWFFFLGGVGMFFPYYSLYLRDHAGLSGTQVGLVVAVPPLVGIVAQPFWGHVADRTGRRTLVLAFVSLGSAVGYALFVFARSFAGFALIGAAHAFFATAVMPGLWSVTLALLRDRGMSAVGWVRASGTVGFGVSVVTLPAFMQTMGPPSWLGSGPNPSLQWMFPLAAVQLGLAALCAFFLPRTGAVGLRAKKGDVGSLRTHKAFHRLLFVVFVAFLCMQGPMSLFPLLVTARGGGVVAISEMWIVMLSLEIPLIAGFGWTVRRFGVRGVLMLGVFSGAIRWTLSGFVSDLTVVTLAQALHGVAVWGILLGAPTYVDAVVPPHLRSTAQALLATVGFGLGTVVSTVAAGVLTDHVGPAAPAQWAGVLSIVLSVAMARLLPPIEERKA